MEYLEKGTGDLIVLVHGMLGDLRGWANQMAGFSQSYRVVAYSRRNHYPNLWSDYPSGYGISGECDDLKGLIKQLGRGTVHLIGSSYGGAIAAVAARDNPDLIRTLTLVDPALGAVVGGNNTFVGHNLARSQMIASVKKSILAGQLEEAARTCYDYLAARPIFDRLPTTMRSSVLQNVRPLLVELSDLPYSFTREDAKRMGMPTLLLSGDRTSRVFLEIKKELAACFPSCEGATVPGASHSPHRQNPDLFNRTVLSFLKKH